ncbi:MAG: CBS domain-containing protein, partial [Kiritimatiellia bacterium]
EAIRRMSAKHIGCLAVTTKAGKLSGIVSERDVLWKIIAEAKSPKTNLVKDAMTPLKQMKTVTPAQTVEECMELISGRRHRHLPVLADGKLVGMVSIGDVVKFLLDAQQSTIQSLEKYITGTF